MVIVSVKMLETQNEGCHGVRQKKDSTELKTNKIKIKKIKKIKKK